MFSDSSKYTILCACWKSLAFKKWIVRIFVPYRASESTVSPSPDTTVNLEFVLVGITIYVMNLVASPMVIYDNRISLRRIGRVHDNNIDPYTVCILVWFVAEWIDGLVQDYSNSIANALELVQSWKALVLSKIISLTGRHCRSWVNNKKQWNIPQTSPINALRPKPHNFADDIYKKAFSWIQILQFRFKCQWNLFLWIEFTLFHHWFR